MTELNVVFRAGRAEAWINILSYRSLNFIMKNAITFILVVLSIEATLATSYTWNGGPGSWADPTQWTPNGVPGPADNVLINGGTATLAGNVTVNNLVMAGGTIDGTGNLYLSGNFDVMTGAFLFSEGNVEVSGTFNWTGGQIGNHNNTVNTDSVIVSGPVIISSSQHYLFAKTLILGSGGTWSGGDITADNHSIFHIPAGQTFTVTAPNGAQFVASLFGYGYTGCYIQNYGTVVKTSPGTVTMGNYYIVFNNSGTVQVSSGLLQMGGSVHTGTFNTLAGAEVRLGSSGENNTGANNTLLLNGTTFTGAGLLSFNAGYVHINAGVTAPVNISVLNGVFYFFYNLTINSLTLNYGELFGMGGNLTVNGNLNFLFGRIVQNATPFTVTVNGLTSISGIEFKSLNFATLTCNGGLDIPGGILWMEGGAHLNVPAGQNFSLGANIYTYGNTEWWKATVNNAGYLQTSGTGLIRIGTKLINSGTIQINNADTLALLHNGYPYFVLSSNSGTIKGNGSFDINGIAFANTGHVAPGLSPGKLRLNGNFANSALDIEIEPNGNTGRIDSLAVTGDVALTGSALNVTEMTCLPNGTYRFLLWTGTRTDSFATLNLPPGYTVQYDDVAKEARLVYVDPFPTITCPGNVAAANSPGLCAAIEVSLGNPVAMDNCPGVLASNNASGSFPVGINNIIWTATDSKGQKATCIQTVTVTDIQLPAPSCPNNIVTFNLPGTCTAPVTYAATASDNCGIQSISYSHAPGSLFPLGVTTVTVTATDLHGNQQTCMFSVTVNVLSERCNGLDDDCNGSPEATINTWNGSGDGVNWSDPANWSDGIVPLPCQHVVIPASSNVTIQPGVNAVGKTLDVAIGAILTISPDATMYIIN
jgi:hypothetical protein